MPVALAALAAMGLWWAWAQHKANVASAVVKQSQTNVLAAMAAAQAAATAAQPTGGSEITLLPNYQQTQTYGVALGDSVTIKLPTGASWAAGGTYQPAGMDTPIAFIY